MDSADAQCSLFIRLKNSDWRGYTKCYTCDKVAHYKDGMQCGHFISRGSHKLRFEEKNLRVQCVGCNVYKNGNYIEFTMRMIAEKGKAFVEKLRKEGKESKTFSVEELKEISNKFKTKIKQLERL